MAKEKGPTSIGEAETQCLSCPESPNLEGQVDEKPQYHAYSRSQKLVVIGLVSAAGLFSPLSSNIYFPALGNISRTMNVSKSKADLTITVYMIVQAIAPSFWGPFSDVLGRRTIMIATLSVYLASNIALSMCNSYAQLMVFRALQAAGSSATISIGSGVISDITTERERGSLVGNFAGLRQFGQGVGPAIGGVLTKHWGFRSIFWFLAICSGTVILLILILLPETLRPIAGNGTVPLKGIHKPLLYNIVGQKDAKEGAVPDAEKTKITFRTVTAPLTFLFEKDVFITLLFGAIIYTTWSMVAASTTFLFEEVYKLDPEQIGLTYLANGFGCMFGSYFTGILMNHNHRKTVHEYCRTHGYPTSTRIDSKSYPDFPIEVARMRNTWWIIALFIIALGGYGASLKTRIAAPIILQFAIAFCSNGVFTINSALIIDLFPGSSGGATAVNNLIRCFTGASGVSVVNPMIVRLTPVWTFVVLAGVVIATYPLFWIEMRYGTKYRQDRLERQKQPESN